jgi:hypothetical protein
MQIKDSFKRFQLAYTGVEAGQGLVRRPDISAAIALLWPRRRLSLAGVSAILGTSIISPLEGSRLRCNAGWRLKAWRGYRAQCIRGAQHRERRLATARRDSYGLSSLTLFEQHARLARSSAAQASRRGARRSRAGPCARKRVGTFAHCSRDMRTFGVRGELANSQNGMRK